MSRNTVDALVPSSSSCETPRPSPLGTKTTKSSERTPGCEPRTLGLHPVFLDGLDEDLLVALEQVVILWPAAAALELGRDDLVDVQERLLLEADLDERGLHAREDVVDDAAS